jgi:hypothetical protein
MALMLKSPPEGRYVQSVERVWFCRGIDIARHWQKMHPYQASA